VLHSFAGGSDGANPTAELTEVNGILYGTTYYGGASNDGTVFKITTSGAESVLYSFAGGSDGSAPFGGLTTVNGVLYGTTYAGGANKGGTVFKITTSGAETVLHSFGAGNDGSSPLAGLTNVNGVLYGTTFAGGGSGFAGTVFEINTSGEITILHRFGGANDGFFPRAGLTDVDGVLYGTTLEGGANRNKGTVFKITTSGAESVLYGFKGGSDGRQPEAGLTNVSGVLYGTTYSGGYADRDDGTVFKITTSGAFTVLHSFGGGNDGRGPLAGLTNVNGVLYGTTYSGGVHYNTGTVFKITTSGTKSAVYRFVGGSDGAQPEATLTYVNGVLYGTTNNGGANNSGTVFSLSL
jgi:uncharacterized repeat protein (TIGR03803 family)